MAVSARLAPKTQLALARYCKTHGLTKTQALERSIALLLLQEGQRTEHSAFVAFQRLRDPSARKSPGHQESVETLKRYLDEKYPA